MFDIWTLSYEWNNCIYGLVQNVFTHLSLYNISLLPQHRLIMQAAYHSDSLSGASDISEAPPGEAANLGFIITSQDTQILQHYLEGFQEADTSARTQLLDRIMGELYRLRPINSPFDKKDAKKVWYSFYIVQGVCGLTLSYRKFRSGFIIATVAPGVNTSSLPANGLLGMPSINSIEMRCLTWPRSSLD
jgi:hypothetical protein